MWRDKVLFGNERNEQIATTPTSVQEGESDF